MEFWKALRFGATVVLVVIVFLLAAWLPGLEADGVPPPDAAAVAPASGSGRLAPSIVN